MYGYPVSFKSIPTADWLLIYIGVGLLGDALFRGQLRSDSVIFTIVSLPVFTVVFLF